MAMDPKELEMVAIVTQQELTEEFKQKIHEIDERERKQSLIAIEKSDKVEEHVDEDTILKPGQKIRPKVTTDLATKLAERLYGIVANEICELISYDDQNFLIHADRNIKNPILPNIWNFGYILKIVNALDSKKEKFFDAQTQMLLFLGQQNIVCPKPVMNIYGKYFSQENVENEKHLVRLLEYQPGKIFNDIPKTNNLYYQAGQFIAMVDNALKHFHHTAYDKHRTLWMLQSVPKLEEFMYTVKDTSQKDIVEQVMEAFDKKVLSNLEQFDAGIIHGDFNEQNILVHKNESLGEYKIAGILDFGDTSYSPYVFELAITMTYMMLQSGNLSTGGLVTAGYSMVRAIPEYEWKVLKVCVAARLCQSLVLGIYSHSLDPANEYVLTTQKAGWDLLEKVWAEKDDDLEELWKKTADDYLTRSYK